MGTAGKILIVEDDSGIVVTLRRVLAEEGHQVFVETRGDTGLARARSDDLDLVLTDMKLPGLVASSSCANFMSPSRVCPSSS